MNSYLRSWLLVSVFGLVSTSYAQPAVPRAEARTSVGVGELATLEHFLALSDAELDQAQRVIERIRAMTPEERSDLRGEIAKYRALPDNQRKQLRMGWGALDERHQAAWQDFMHGLSLERRTEIQNHLQTLAPEEKATYRRSLVDAYLAANPAP